MSMFLLIFYTDAVKLKPVTAGAIIVACRIFDAFNDPLMGVIVDKTRNKWGRYKPYLLFSPPLVLISTVLLFTSPFDAEAHQAAAVVWAAFTYVLWGICFTVQDVPFWGMSSAITPLESDTTLTGLLLMITLVPAAGFLLTAIPMLFNDYTGETKRSIQKELAERRGNQNETAVFAD